MSRKQWIIVLGLIVLFTMLSCNLERAAELVVSPTPTQTSTVTVTPTRTIKPTWTTIPTPTLSDEWLELSGRYYTLIMPVTWETIDVDSVGLESALRELSRIDDDWSETETWMLEDEDIQDNIMLIGREIKPSAVLDTSVRLFAYGLDGTIKSRHLCDELEEDFEDNEHVDVKEVRCGLDINGMDAARFDLRYIYKHYTTREISYYYILGSNLWVLEFHVLESKLDQYKDIIDTIGNSFDAKEPKPVS